MNDNEWAESLITRRKKQDIKQGQLARAVNITREHLNRIEHQTRTASVELKEKLDFVLDNMNLSEPLFLLIDYVRIRFNTLDERYVMEKILRIKKKYMGQEEYGFYGYSSHYFIGDIFIFISADEKKGTLLELKGQGCRQFECYLKAQGRSWYDFFDTCIKEKAVIKRVDLAINDRIGILNVSNLIQKCKDDECVSVFRRFRDYGSGELVSSREDNRKEMGKTLYIGSMKSDIYFCVYEKAYEQYVKNDIPVEESEVKNRFEIRLKNERSEQAVLDLIEYQDGERTAFSIINNYLRFVDKDNTKRRSEWKVNEDWLWFIGKNRNKLKLTTQAEPYNVNKTRNWMAHQVAASQKMLAEIDRLNGTTFLDDTLKKAKLNAKHKKIIEQSTRKIEDMIV